MKEDEEKRFRELLALYHSGPYTREETFTQLVYGFNAQEFSDLVALFPDALKALFRDWTVRHFDNNKKADQFFMLTNDRALPHAALQSIRR